MKNIDYKRLKTSFIEYWLLNKGKLMSIPVVVVVLFILSMFWYGTPLFDRVFFGAYSDSIGFAERLADYQGGQNKEIILFIIPLYLILCTVSYFKLLTKTVFGTMTPISRGERMLTLWAGNIVIIFSILTLYFLTDWAFTSIMKSLYLAEVTEYKDSVGDLFFKFGDRTYFATSQRDIYAVATVLSLGFTCVYQLATIFFRKYSIPLFALMLMGFFYVMFMLLKGLFKDVNYRFDQSEITPSAMMILFALVALGVVITTYFRLREREIY
ncbi:MULTISPECIES: hypothetical protein [Sphingobacterium]|uniref:ABC transporter permease n=1 Tax=Sphingobacterium populi TaxID=1812824 RepID=A0ABW5UB73_9SPHI|nr:hypothetical protein [Sphingobacterium sp. CFCC 11742]